METSVLSPEEERLIIKDVAAAAESLCKEGDAFYLITHRWWHDWLQYVSQETACIPNGFGDNHCEADSAYARRPSCIDNSNLIFEVKSEDANGNVELQDALMKGRDYVLVPQEVWKRLHNWYGGGPTLERKAICSGALQQELAVEVYPLCLQLISAPRGDKAVVRISKKKCMVGYVLLMWMPTCTQAYSGPIILVDLQAFDFLNTKELIREVYVAEFIVCVSSAGVLFPFNFRYILQLPGAEAKPPK